MAPIFALTAALSFSLASQTVLAGIIPSNLVSRQTVAGITVQSAPQINTILQDKMQTWAGTAKYWPDGKMLAFKSDPTNKTSSFIMNITPDFRMTSSTGLINDSTLAPAGADFSKYPNRIDGPYWTNFAILPPTQSYPGVNITGLRDQGQYYDSNTVWLFNAFRLSETSQPNTTSSTNMIGFVHNEDYWANQNLSKSCTYKSIGVRYSSDLGLSWTRSVPIITAGVQCATCGGCSSNFTGTGDFATMWDPVNKRWVIMAQENWLVMSYSNDPLGRPGTWTKLNPGTGLTAPGFIGGDSAALAHSDLKSVAGSNPSIIYDSQKNVWHMVYASWGGGLFYTRTTDLIRWSTPSLVALQGTYNHPSYPTLMGDGGDTLTSRGNATLYFTADWPEGSGNHTTKCLYSAPVVFGGN